MSAGAAHEARGVHVSAPGKMMIAGEYAVLEGAEAVVAAVDRRAHVRLSPPLPGAPAPAALALPPEVIATRAAVEARLGPVDGVLSLDVAALQQEGKKLGLGSSAAAAAATAGALLLAHGRDPSAPEARQLALELALLGHGAIAPEGSGADVAASVLGGYIRFRKLGAGVETHPLPWPSALCPVVVWTGQPARTSNLVAQVRTLAQASPNQYRYCMRTLAGEAEQLVSALLDADLAAVLESFHVYGSAMGALGDAAGALIMDETTTRIRALARSLGGAAKPSGAGGGDVALALFSSEASAFEFRTRCAEVGFQVLSISLGVPGERDEEP